MRLRPREFELWRGLDAHRDDPEKAAAVKAAFGENLIDANNGDHADTVADDLNNKVIARFLEEV